MILYFKHKINIIMARHLNLKVILLDSDSEVDSEVDSRSIEAPKLRRSARSTEASKLRSLTRSTEAPTPKVKPEVKLCNHIFKQGFHKGTQCTTKPRKNAEFCSLHKPKTLPTQSPKGRLAASDGTVEDGAHIPPTLKIKTKKKQQNCCCGNRTSEKLTKNALQCSVCLRTKINKVLITCGHPFCGTCIPQFNNKCALCRATFKNTDVITLYI